VRTALIEFAPSLRARVQTRRAASVSAPSEPQRNEGTKSVGQAPSANATGKSIFVLSCSRLIWNHAGSKVNSGSIEYRQNHAPNSALSRWHAARPSRIWLGDQRCPLATRVPVSEELHRATISSRYARKSYYPIRCRYRTILLCGFWPRWLSLPSLWNANDALVFPSLPGESLVSRRIAGGKEENATGSLSRPLLQPKASRERQRPEGTGPSLFTGVSQLPSNGP
jgi:hypothetical protein